MIYRMLGRILFNIFIADLFLVIGDIDLANYWTILQSTTVMIGDDVITSMTESAENLFQ